MVELKTYVLTISNHFLKGHPRSGQPTNFIEQIKDGRKIHTIRANYLMWKNVVNYVNAGKGILSLRCWAGKPYNSKQIEFMQVTKSHVEPIIITGNGSSIWLKDRYPADYEIEKLAKNDGLSLQDFRDWFTQDMKAGIIHFTDFRY